MARMSIRGLDEQTLARLKQQAEQEGSSLNGLVLRMLQGSTADSPSSNALRKFDDLDGLGGTWSEEDAQNFERHTLAFAEVDPALWRQEDVIP